MAPLHYPLGSSDEAWQGTSSIQVPSVIETDLPPDTSEQPLTVPSIIAQPRILPVVTDHGEERIRHEEPQNNPPTPTVQVTIGRIEVRAVQATTSSASKTRVSQPVMNLDDYLRGRSNGGAR